jgi:hypothetical protein
MWKFRCAGSTNYVEAAPRYKSKKRSYSSQAGRPTSKLALWFIASGPYATCPRSRKVFGYFPSPQILNDPKSLYQAPSGASGSDSRHIFSWHRSSAVIFRSASLSKRWSRSPDAKSVHCIFGIDSPKVMRASFSLICFRSAGSEVALSWSANSKNLDFSASFDSIPVSINSTKTRFVLVLRFFASVRTRRARRAGRDTLCRMGFSAIVMVQFYTTSHHYAPLQAQLSLKGAWPHSAPKSRPMPQSLDR